MENNTLTNNKEAQRFEWYVDGQVSFIEYQREGERVYLSHTEVPKEQSGAGIASIMVEKTFQYLAENNLKMVPGCSFVRNFLKRHPDWGRLLPNTD